MSEYKIFECMFVLLTNFTEETGWQVSEKRKEYIIAKTNQEVVEKMDQLYEVPKQLVGYVHTIPVADIDTSGFIDYYDERQYEI